MFRFGSTVRPNPIGDHDPVFSSGWSPADQAGYAWIEGAAADLEFDLPPVLGDLTFEIDCFPVDLSGCQRHRNFGARAGVKLGRGVERVGPSK